MNRDWSEYQQQIFTWPGSVHRHAIIQASPGGAKTTTAVETLKYIDSKALFLAFSSKIAAALQPKMPRGAEAKTFNAFGWRVCLQHFPNVQLDANKTFNVLKGFVSEQELFYTLQAPMRRIVSILKNMNQTTTDAWEECADKCGMELPDWRSETHDAFCNLLPDVYEECLRNTNFFDFDDQVFQPIFRDLPIPKYPFVFVDEAQDLNAVNIHWLRQLSNTGSRLFMVGDENQSIYSFRGSLIDSMDILRAVFAPKDYDLPICYRCPDEVIKLAQEINPKMEAPVPNPNGKGLVETIKLNRFREIVEPGHFVISRTTLPLVTEVMRLVVKGVLAYVEGKEVTQNLFKVIDRIWYDRMGSKDNLDQLVADYRKGCTFDSYDISDFTEALEADRRERIPRLEREGKEELIEILNETTDTIHAIAESCQHVPALISKIETIFKESSEVTRPAVRAMTIHKVKGLENKIVHHIAPENIPHYRAVKSGKESALKQERNLKFVADTRSQSDYYLVEKPRKDY